MSGTKIKPALYKDRYWAPVIYLFTKHNKLESVFSTKYFNFDTEEIRMVALKRQAGVWSHSEKIMLNLALHLFNSRNKFNLSDLDYLDDFNRQLAYQAMKIRFGG